MPEPERVPLPTEAPASASTTPVAKLMQQPAPALTSTPKAARAASPRGKPEWIVIGGTEKKDGLLVHPLKDLKSQELFPLGMGARIEEVSCDGERLQFRKLHVIGPGVGCLRTLMKNRETFPPA